MSSYQMNEKNRHFQDEINNEYECGNQAIADGIRSPRTNRTQAGMISSIKNGLGMIRERPFMI